MFNCLYVLRSNTWNSTIKNELFNVQKQATFDEAKNQFLQLNKIDYLCTF